MGATPTADLGLNARPGDGAPVHVEISCKKCGARSRMDLGDPGERPVEEFLHLVTERLSHQPSFQCFGGHLELAAPLPRFWVVHWDTLEP